MISNNFVRCLDFIIHFIKVRFILKSMFLRPAKLKYKMINLNPFINLISAILSIYNFCLIAYIILYYLTLFKVINIHNQFVKQIYSFLFRIIEPVLARIRKFVPSINGVDISMIVLFLAIYFLRDVLYTYFYVL